jgi:hypothetical protein
VYSVVAFSCGWFGVDCEGERHRACACFWTASLFNLLGPFCFPVHKKSPAKLAGLSFLMVVERALLFNSDAIGGCVETDRK